MEGHKVLGKKVVLAAFLECFLVDIGIDMDG